jgi:hypothetical protein
VDIANRNGQGESACVEMFFHESVCEGREARGSQIGGNKDCTLIEIAMVTDAVLEYKLQIGLVGIFLSLR